MNIALSLEILAYSATPVDKYSILQLPQESLELIAAYSGFELEPFITHKSFARFVVGEGCQYRIKRLRFERKTVAASPKAIGKPNFVIAGLHPLTSACHRA